jgi:hypothetical protein
VDGHPEEGGRAKHRLQDRRRRDAPHSFDTGEVTTWQDRTSILTSSVERAPEKPGMDLRRPAGEVEGRGSPGPSKYLHRVQRPGPEMDQ